MKPSKSKNLDKYLFNTISYFSFFEYPPSFSEIHTFFPEKIAKSKLKMLLESLIKQQRLIRSSKSFRRSPPNRRMTEKSSPAFGGTHIYRRSARFLSSESELRNDSLDCQNSPKYLPSTFNLQLSTPPLYTLPQYTEKFKIRNLKFINLFDLTLQRREITQKKLASMYRYIELLQKIPFIRLVGITGSASMGNCTQNDDVDLFIITSRNCLFIGRFFTILLAHIFHVRKGKNSVCLNLFFDESDLVIPLQKQTPYVAHEVLQMRSVVNKGQVYERFLKANEWVKQFYPNTKLASLGHSRPVSGHGVNSSGFTPVRVNPVYNFLFLPFELALKMLQLAIIRRNKTGLIISPTQLWLFRRDFEKKIHVIARRPTYVG